MAWPVWAAPVIAGAATGLVSALGGQQAAETNAAAANRATDVNQYEAARNREFQAQQSSAQMSFQRDMSNTSYQRAKEDLIKAGMNPLLALSQGASTPSGAAASGAQAQAVAPPPVPNNLGNALQNAVSTFNAINQARTTNAQATLAEAQVTKIPQELASMKASEGLSNAQIKALNADQAFKNFKFKLWTLGNKTFDALEEQYKTHARDIDKIYNTRPEFNPSGMPGID